MNSKMKRRLGVVTGVIVIIVIVVFAVVGGNSAAKTMTVAEALDFADDAKVQVTGNVVDNSFAIDGDTLTFRIYDSQADPERARQLDVRYDGGVSATFGNDVTAICTGKKNSEGVLVCSELITKCPSKYENAEGSLTVDDLLGYGSSVIDKPVKVSGILKPGTLAGVDAAERFVLASADSSSELSVRYDGALSDDTDAGSPIVLTGSLGADGAFTATAVALEA